MQWLAHWYFQFEPVFKDSVPGLVLLLGGGLVNLVLSRLVLRALHRSRLPLSIDTKLLIRRSTAWLLWLMLILLVLHAWGVKVDGIWTMLASALAVIGVGLLAVWTMASNITASLFIWIWRPYNLGQHIEILPEGLKGRAVDASSGEHPTARNRWWMTWKETLDTQRQIDLAAPGCRITPKSCWHKAHRILVSANISLSSGSVHGFT